MHRILHRGLAALIILAFLLSGRRLSRLESVILIAMYVTYLTVRMGLHPDDVPMTSDVARHATQSSEGVEIRSADADFCGPPKRVYSWDFTTPGRGAFATIW